MMYHIDYYLHNIKNKIWKIHRSEHDTNVKEGTPLVIAYDKQIPAEVVRDLYKSITWFLMFEKIPWRRYRRRIKIRVKVTD